jgi:ubiquinone biosynthesis protein COQ9
MNTNVSDIGPAHAVQTNKPPQMKPQLNQMAQEFTPQKQQQQRLLQQQQQQLAAAQGYAQGMS